MMTCLRPALVLLVLLSLLTGGLYPALVTAVAGRLFPDEAAGSLIEADGALAGSRLIGQNFDDPRHFWGRPSATAPQPYNGAASSGSNLGPLNPALAETLRARVQRLLAADPDNPAAVPADLVQASGSGLDPHISPAAAAYQIGRIARLRQVDRAELAQLVAAHTEGRQWGLFGEPRVHVLALNRALDARFPEERR